MPVKGGLLIPKVWVTKDVRVKMALPTINTRTILPKSQPLQIYYMIKTAILVIVEEPYCESASHLE